MKHFDNTASKWFTREENKIREKIEGKLNKSQFDEGFKRNVQIEYELNQMKS